MRTKMKWVELHNPMFLGGANLGVKLDPSKRAGIEMVWDSSERMLVVTYGGEETWVTETGVFHMKPGEPEAPKRRGPEPTPGKKVQAQASTPQSHVFEPGKPLPTAPKMKF